MLFDIMKWNEVWYQKYIRILDSVNRMKLFRCKTLFEVSKNVKQGDFLFSLFIIFILKKGYSLPKSKKTYLGFKYRKIEWS